MAATETEEEVGGVMYQSTSDKVRVPGKEYFILSGWNEKRKATKCSAADFNPDGSFKSMHDDHWYDKWGYANTLAQGERFGISGITEVDPDDFGYMYKEKMPKEKAEDKQKNPKSCKGGGGCCGGGKACKQDGLCGGGNCCKGKGICSCKVSPLCEQITNALAAATCAQAMATQNLNVDVSALVALEIAIPDPTAAVCKAAKKACCGAANACRSATKAACSASKAASKALNTASLEAALGDAAPLAIQAAAIATEVSTVAEMLEGLTSYKA